MAEHPIEARRRAEWERIRQAGVWPHAFRRGLLRGVPMGLAIVLALELLRGRPLDAGWLRDSALLGRCALAVVLFSLGGMLSTWARWRALELRFGEAARED
jgi:hypothetical protein